MGKEPTAFLIHLHNLQFLSSIFMSEESTSSLVHTISYISHAHHIRNFEISVFLHISKYTNYEILFDWLKLTSSQTSTSNDGCWVIFLSLLIKQQLMNDQTSIAMFWQ